MARKETPDVLGDILAGAAEPAEPAVAKPATAPRQPRRAPKVQTKPKPTAAAPAIQGWDYLVVSFGEYRGWRPRFINGQELRNWMQAPIIHDYIAQLGEDGWEMVGAGGGKALYGNSDYYQVFFKRPRH